MLADPVVSSDASGEFQTQVGTSPSGATLGTTGARDYGTPEAIHPDSESPFAMGDSWPDEITENDRVLEEAEEPQSLGRQLMRSLGGLIWILLLIAFSIARDCGE